jgi:hypothetical protein
VKRKTRKTKNISGKANCDICNDIEYLEEHHINGRKISDPHNSNNIACICPNCHTKVHMGDIIIEKWVLTSMGRELFWHKRGEDSFTGIDSSPHIIKF